MNHIFKKIRENRVWVVFIAAGLLLWGCAHHQPLPQETQQWVYTIGDLRNDMVLRWSPNFVIYGHHFPYNRIGRPTVLKEKSGGEKVIIDTDHPIVYVMQRPFTTDKGTYTNLVYRIHFPEVPFSLVPFNLTAGKNVGILVVVTLDAGLRPILVTTVGTCGCYKAIVPTGYLSRSAFPENWTDGTMEVYGEQLPGLLDYGAFSSPHLWIHLRPGVHRVMDLKVMPPRPSVDGRYRMVFMDIGAMSDLTRLPTVDGATSLYHMDGVLKGYVKGSVKLWESLFMSLFSLDLFVGTDKAYGDPAVTGNRFYTSLKPWRRKDSDMWDFARFLRYWGWRL